MRQMCRFTLAAVFALGIGGLSAAEPEAAKTNEGAVSLTLQWTPPKNSTKADGAQLQVVAKNEGQLPIALFSLTFKAKTTTKEGKELLRVGSYAIGGESVKQSVYVQDKVVATCVYEAKEKVFEAEFGDGCKPLVLMRRSLILAPQASVRFNFDQRAASDIVHAGDVGIKAELSFSEMSFGVGKPPPRSAGTEWTEFAAARDGGK